MNRLRPARIPRVERTGLVRLLGADAREARNDEPEPGEAPADKRLAEGFAGRGDGLDPSKNRAPGHWR